MSEAPRLVPRSVNSEGQAKEGRNERFRRLAAKRMQDALNRIDRVGAFGKQRGVYSEDEARRMIAALRERVDEAERQLLPPSFPEFIFE